MCPPVIVTELTPAILNEFISRIEVYERDQKRARYAIQHISIYFNYIGKFEKAWADYTNDFLENGPASYVMQRG